MVLVRAAESPACRAQEDDRRLRERRAEDAIDKCAWFSPDLPFYYKAMQREGNDRDYLTNEVYKTMRTVGKRCGVTDCRPHRLRDTFAIGMLLRGVSLDDVSRLLGHSSVKITEQYYAKWVAARKVRLESVVADAVGAPQPYTTACTVEKREAA